jgi:uncharacterized protein involved in exopolysaccharide biosynthesis
MKALSGEENQFPPLFDVGAVWATLWQRRLVVVASVSAAVLAAVCYLAVTTPTYTATASLLIDPRDTRSTAFESVLPGIGPDSAAVASQVFVIESRDLLMAVFAGEGIEDDAEFASEGLLSFLSKPSGSQRDVIFRRFERRVSVERAGLTYVIEVSFKSESPVKAARIANAIVAQYKAGLAGERENANSDVNGQLENRLGALQKNVAAAEHAVGDFKVRHDIVDQAGGGTLQSQIDQLTTQVIEARSASDRARGQYEQALAAGPSSEGLARLSEIVSSSAIDRLRTDYNQRAAELASAEAIYQARHPTIRRLRSELARTSGLLTAEAGRITRELKAKSELSAQAVVALDGKLSALRAKARDADLAKVELRRLEAKAAAARTVLDDVLKRKEETSQMRGLQRSEARVIGVAAPPVQPTWPTPALLLPVSAGLGLVIGCGIAAMLGPARSSGAPPRREKSARGTTQAAGRMLPTRLGRYDLPGLKEAGTASRIRAMRRRFLHRGGEAFSQNTFQLVRRMIALLTEHPAPYILLVSPVGSPEVARLAGAMLGIGLQRAGQNVLLVELRAGGRRGATGDLAALDAGAFIDGASGLPTVVRTLSDGKDLSGLGHGEETDFILLVGLPLADVGRNAALLPKLDLMLVALDPSEDAGAAVGMMGRCFGENDAPRAGILIIGSEEAEGEEHAAILPAVRLRGRAL